MKNDRVLNDDALERKAIGSMLMHENTKPVFDRYGGAELFYRESSRWAWRAIEAITEELGTQAVLDGSAIVAWLTSRGAFTPSGGARWFQECRQTAVGALACETVAKQLRELHERRTLMRLGSAIREMAWEGLPREEILGEIQRTTHGLMVESKARSAHEVAREVLRRHDELMAGERDADIQSTGIPWLDYAVGGGVSPGHSYYVAGLYKAGKTKFVGYLAWALMEQGWSVDWYSVEMSELEMMTRLLSCDSNVSETRLTKGKVHDSAEYGRLVESVFDTKGWDWRHQMKGKWRAEDICASAAHRVIDNPDKQHLIVVDYIQDVGLRDNRGFKGHEVVSEASRMMNALSKELSVPVVVISQLTPSKVEGRKGANNKFTPVPVPSDARGSADLLMHANHLCIIHRPWWQLHGSESRFTVCDLALTRHGGSRRLYLYSDLTYNRYAPWESDIPQPFDVLYDQDQVPWRADVDG